MEHIQTPVGDNDIEKLNAGDQILISGTVYTGRDAALPQLVKVIEENKLDFNIHGSAIMHTAVSDAGIAPTTSNKYEIESTIPFLSEHGVKIHIGKGMLSQDTVNSLEKNNSIFVITPPVAALLTDKIITKKCIAFENEGMEAMYELKVEKIPGIVAVSKGKHV